MKITVGMIRFLDERDSKGIQTPLEEIQKRFALTLKETLELITHYLKIPVIK